VALFPGHPGIMQLQEVDGLPKFGQGGNFVVRARRFWLDDETLVTVVDAPSDQWGSFSQRFRETDRYGTDVAALIGDIGKQFDIHDWTFVGTSEGSITAFHAARMNPALAKRVILTSSVFRAGRNGPGLTSARYEDLKSTKLLWVHHENDPCDFTQYRDARSSAERSGAPLVTVHGGGPFGGDACMPFSQHGYVGLEKEVVLAMRSWIKTGLVPADVKP
jgi:pimeloyl-ACP methyl ester carboxylesterase